MTTCAARTFRPPHAADMAPAMCERQASQPSEDAT